MGTTSENPSLPEINSPDSPTDPIDGSDSPIDPEACIRDRDHLHAELDSLRPAYPSLQSKSAASEENILVPQQGKDETTNRSGSLMKMMDEISPERDALRDKMAQTEEASRREAEASEERIRALELEKGEQKEFLLKGLEFVKSVKEKLVNIIECLDDEKVIEGESSGGYRKVERKLDRESMALWEEETAALAILASKAEARVSEFKEGKNMEKKELEKSVVSLTEENRDINTLLRVALVEKEAVEKSLNKLKGNCEQRRVPLLQFAERGLQRVGFGFMMGSTGSNGQSPDSSGADVASTASNKSDNSECEDEVVSLASTVERMMKNLRLEITQLRRSLEESRSDTKRLQSLTEKQAETIEENVLYIKELEDRERVLAQSVKELLSEIKETEEDVDRWRKACELEVEAGKFEIEERDKLVFILKHELEKTKAALAVSNGKIKLKEELAAAAMAAQAAAETSLQLADSRAAELREQIEELTKQLEEAESKEQSRPEVRYICWPWRLFRLNAANNTNGRAPNVRRMIPEMQALNHHMSQSSHDIYEC